MPRRNRPPKRQTIPDPKYGDKKLESFINRVMKGGKKSTARRVIYSSLSILEERTNKSGLEVFQSALREVSPVMEVRPRRVGGATYQVPMEVDAARQFALATRWILEAARSRTGNSFAEKLADELMDATNKTGQAFRKREESHRMADANRAFSHYRL
ncbi:MAG: 30S ribosomal protein S7 [Chloroflexota bacterium]